MTPSSSLPSAWNIPFPHINNNLLFQITCWQGILTKAVQHLVHRGAPHHPIKLRWWCTIPRTAKITVLPSLITILLLFCYTWASWKGWKASWLQEVRVVTTQLQWPAMFPVPVSTRIQQPHKPDILVNNEVLTSKLTLESSKISKFTSIVHSISLL